MIKRLCSCYLVCLIMMTASATLTAAEKTGKKLKQSASKTRPSY